MMARNFVKEEYDPEDVIGVVEKTKGYNSEKSEGTIVKN